MSIRKQNPFCFTFDGVVKDIFAKLQDKQPNASDTSDRTYTRSQSTFQFPSFGSETSLAPSFQLQFDETSSTSQDEQSLKKLDTKSSFNREIYVSSAKNDFTLEYEESPQELARREEIEKKLEIEKEKRAKKERAKKMKFV